MNSAPSETEKLGFFMDLGAIFILFWHWFQQGSPEAIPPSFSPKSRSSEPMAGLAEPCSLALSKYSSSSKCICSSVVCWNGRTLTQKAVCSFRESLMLNEMGFKWEKGGVAGISSIVHPLWGWHLCDKVIKGAWTCYTEVLSNQISNWRSAFHMYVFS